MEKDFTENDPSLRAYLECFGLIMPSPKPEAVIES